MKRIYFVRVGKSVSPFDIMELVENPHRIFKKETQAEEVKQTYERYGKECQIITLNKYPYIEP